MSYTNMVLGGNWEGEWPEHIYVSHEIGRDCEKYVPERTCQLRYDEVHRDYVCSSCGVWLSIDSYQSETDNGTVYRRFKYCPECGARVKEENK